MAFLAFAQGGKIAAAFLVFFNPFARKAAVLNARQDFFHGSARGICHHLRATSKIAIFGGIGDGIAHPRQATLIDEIDNQFHFMQTLEVGDLGLITGLHESVEASFDELADAATQNGLLAEQIGFRFFREGSFQYAGARAAESFGVRQRKSFGIATGILLDGDERGRAAAFGENFADAMARRFRRDHGDINIGGRLDGAEANVKAVREHQRLALVQMRRDRILVELGLLGVWRENHDHIGPGGGFGRRVCREAFLLGFG